MLKIRRFSLKASFSLFLVKNDGNDFFMLYHRLYKMKRSSVLGCFEYCGQNRKERKGYIAEYVT